MTPNPQSGGKGLAMPDPDEKKHWVFRVHLADRAGALTSIASAFSNRGISIDTVVGHGSRYTSRHDGTVVVTFWCTESEKDEIVRVVSRLSKITGLEEHAYASEILRKSALIRTTRRLTPPDVCGQEQFIVFEAIRDLRVPGNFEDSFAASGAGSQHIWVCPSLDLVVAQSPGPWEDQKENDTGPIRWIVDALSI